MPYLPLLLGLAVGAVLGFLLARARQASDAIRLAAESSAVQTEAARMIATLQTSLEASQSRLADMMAERAEARTQAEAQQRECARLAAELQGDHARLTSLGSQLQLARAELATAQAELLPLRDLKTQLDTEKRLLQEARADQQRFLAETQTQFREAFASLAGQTLETTTGQFLTQAEEKFKALQDLVSKDLEGRQRSIEEVLAPVKDTLKQLDEKTHRLETERADRLGRLDSQLSSLAESHLSLSRETRKLTEALKSSKARGRWGEIALQRLLELAGLTLHVDFLNQEAQEDEEGRILRPDCIITLPGQRCLVVDVKVPFTGYYEACEATDEKERTEALKRHAAAVQTHVRTLAGKAYQKQVGGALDFVVMFVPNDTFLAAAVESRPELLEEALTKRVLLLTPASLLALLHAIARGWELHDVQANAEEIRKLG
ncbi:MAG TPA: DNA recombination protein RmuC, partial [bacterium]|nr:DNA recombination protein RmuC [bacterium]